MTPYIPNHLRHAERFPSMGIQLARRLQRQDDLRHDDMFVLVRSLHPMPGAEDVPDDAPHYFDIDDAICEDVADRRRLCHEPVAACFAAHAHHRELFHPSVQYFERFQSAIRIDDGLTVKSVRAGCQKLVANRYLVDPVGIVLTQSALPAPSTRGQ